MKQKGFSLIELMVVIAILGVLVSIAIPAYWDHVIRARVSEGLSLATAAKIAVSETVMANHELPASQEMTGYLSPAATGNVQSITIGSNGVITISYPKSAGNGTLLLVPTLQANGDLTWSCDKGTLLAKYRPASCRASE